MENFSSFLIKLSSLSGHKIWQSFEIKHCPLGGHDMHFFRNDIFLLRGHEICTSFLDRRFPFSGHVIWQSFLVKLFCFVDMKFARILEVNFFHYKGM